MKKNNSRASLMRPAAKRQCVQRHGKWTLHLDCVYRAPGSQHAGSQHAADSGARINIHIRGRGWPATTVTPNARAQCISAYMYSATQMLCNSDWRRFMHTVLYMDAFSLYSWARACACIQLAKQIASNNITSIIIMIACTVLWIVGRFI